MYKSWLYFFVAVFLLCSFLPQAQAGILRDFIKERRQNKTSANVLTPSFADVAYGEDEKQTMDIYIPQNAHDAPIIVMVHGGAWKYGDKTMRGKIGSKASHYLRKGYIFVSIDYRLLPTPPDQQAQDVASAVAMIQANAANWGGNPYRIVLMGHSAGAHLVALLSAHPSAWVETRLKPWAGTISLDSAALDLVKIMSGKHHSIYDDAFGDNREYWSENSPFSQLSGDAVPVFAACSTTRKDDSCANAQEFVAAGQNMGKLYKILPVEKSHKDMMADVGVDSEYTAKIDQFIESVISYNKRIR